MYFNAYHAGVDTRTHTRTHIQHARMRIQRESAQMDRFEKHYDMYTYICFVP